MLNSDFTNAKISDKVTDLILGYGVITNITPEDSFPIKATFMGTEFGYLFDGKTFALDFLPTLYKGHINVNSFNVAYNEQEN